MRKTYCQKRIKEEGLKDEFELQSYFVKRIEKFVNEKGREIIGWGKQNHILLPDFGRSTSFHLDAGRTDY